MRRFENFKELQEGNCIVIGKNKITGTEKEFEGKFNSKLKVLFFAISDLYEVVAYIQ